MNQYRVTTKFGFQEKLGIRKIKKSLEFEQKSPKNLGKPEIFNNLYILSSKILTWHQKYISYK